MVAGSRICLGMLIAAMLAVLVATAVAHGQERLYTFDMPAEALGDALRGFGQIAHQQIIFSEDAVRGKRSPRLKGSFTVDEALRRLLGTTRLTVRRTSDGVIYIESPVGAQKYRPAGGANER